MSSGRYFDFTTIWTLGYYYVMNLEQGPRLRVEELFPVEATYLCAWNFADQAQYVPPMQAGLKEFMLWHGSFDDSGQTPVLAVPISTRTIFTPNNLRDWVFGIAYQELVVASHDPLGAFLDAAVYPADTLRIALGQLACIAPADRTVLTGAV